MRLWPKFNNRKVFTLLISIIILSSIFYLYTEPSNQYVYLKVSEQVKAFYLNTKPPQDQQKLSEEVKIRPENTSNSQISFDIHNENGGEVSHYTDHKDENLSTVDENKINGLREFLWQYPVDGGLMIGDHGDLYTPSTFNIAIGGGLTSARLPELNETLMLEKMQLFNTLIPSFCKTLYSDNATTFSTKLGNTTSFKWGFNLHFYFAFDFSDRQLLTLTKNGLFKKVFQQVVDSKCPNGLKIAVHMVQCTHRRNPARAQNDAMIEAYLDNIDYFYRVNDDTQMVDNGWPQLFIEKLHEYNPPNVGVVGPQHSGGNMGILTYDFTHKSHATVFGFHYPRLFTDWWGDDWITNVYKPERLFKHPKARLRHTLALGQRYSVRDWKVRALMHEEVKIQKVILDKYITGTEYRWKEALKEPSAYYFPTGYFFKPRKEASKAKKVISMALYGSNPRDTWGAIRNAQLNVIYFPGWVIRFYVLDPSLCKSKKKDDEMATDYLSLNSSATVFNIDSVHYHMDLDGPTSNHSHSSDDYCQYVVSSRILKRLTLLGAEIFFVNPFSSSFNLLKSSENQNKHFIEPKNWHHLVILDPHVEYFLMRNVRGRLNALDSHTTNKWIESQTETSGILNNIFELFSGTSNHFKPFIYSILDHPDMTDAFPRDTWGGNAPLLRRFLETMTQKVIQRYNDDIQNTIMPNLLIQPGLPDLYNYSENKTQIENKSKKTETIIFTDLRLKLTGNLKIEYIKRPSCDDSVGVPRLFFVGQQFDNNELPYQITKLFSNASALLKWDSNKNLSNEMKSLNEIKKVKLEDLDGGGTLNYKAVSPLQICQLLKN